jgi:hypothetical protein
MESIAPGPTTLKATSHAVDHTLVISQPMLFPWVGLLEQAQLADTYVHYDDVQFSKGGFLNRVQIKTAQGVQWLTIPIACAHSSTQIIDVQVNRTTGFREKHLRTLRQAYAQAPYRELMLDLVASVYATRSDWLADLTIASVEALWDAFSVRPSLSMRSSGLFVPGTNSERVLTLCQKLGATTYVSGHGGKNYLDHVAFHEAGIDVQYMNYECREYPQLHGIFTPFVSALDLLANLGPEGRTQIASHSSTWATPTTH